MRTPLGIVLLATLATPAAHAAQEESVDGSAAAIRKVVSGEICRGDDVLVFGPSTPGSPGTFERQGQPKGTYLIGYGTILVRRGQDLHGHVTAVSPAGHLLYFSAGTYRCEKDRAQE